jgi:hypothetical protein
VAGRLRRPAFASWIASPSLATRGELVGQPQVRKHVVDDDGAALGGELARLLVLGDEAAEEERRLVVLDGQARLQARTGRSSSEQRTHLGLLPLKRFPGALLDSGVVLVSVG